jgi:hypothetical protein
LRTITSPMERALWPQRSTPGLWSTPAATRRGTNRSNTAQRGA